MSSVRALVPVEQRRYRRVAVSVLATSIACTATNLADVAKTRAQLAVTCDRGILGGVAHVLRTDGLGGASAGLSTALAYQISSTGVRLSLFDVTRDAVWAARRHEAARHGRGCRSAVRNWIATRQLHIRTPDSVLASKCMRSDSP